MYYQHQLPKAELTKDEKKIVEMADELDVKVIIPRLDEYKKQKLLDIFEDYEVVHG